MEIAEVGGFGVRDRRASGATVDLRSGCAQLECSQQVAPVKCSVGPVPFPVKVLYGQAA